MFYEDDIKEAVRQEKQLFGDLGESVIISEKGIMVSNTIADLLVFSEKKGIIGIEIKTERDSTARLKSQLDNYRVVCDYVYVLCHDKHVAKVKSIIKANGMQGVGIMSYLDFRGTPIIGINIPSTLSPRKSVHMAWNTLWKAEIYSILGMIMNHPLKSLENEDPSYKVHIQSSSSWQVMPQGYGVNPRHTTKKQMIKYVLARIGEKNANELLCNVFIHGRKRSEQLQLLRYHYFTNPH